MEGIAVITVGILNNLVTAAIIKESTTFKGILELDEKIIERSIKKSIKKIESSDYLNQRIVGLEVTTDQLENLGIAIEELTISNLLTSSDESIVKGYKSEKLSDYSYTMRDGVANSHVDIDYLIEDLKKSHGTSKSLTRISVI